MTARCRTCGKHWNVSIKANIPKTGYMCPRCSIKQRKSAREAVTSTDTNDNMHL